MLKPVRSIDPVVMLLSIVLAGTTLGLLLSDPGPGAAAVDGRGLPADFLLIWFFGFIFFVLVDLLAGRLEDGLWAGYLYFIVVVIWLAAQQVVPALLLIYAGSLVTAGLRGVLRHRPEFEGLFTTGRLHYFLSRTLILAAGLLIAHAVYDLVRGDYPFFAGILESATLLPLVPALVAGMLVIQVTGLLTVRQLPAAVRPNPLQIRKHRGQWIAELLLLAVAPFIAALIVQSGSVAALILLALLLRQALRYHETRIISHQLEQASTQMTLLDQFSRDLAGGLDTDEIMMLVQRYISPLLDEHTLFYIALYDTRRARLDYPVLIIRQQRATGSPANGLLNDLTHQVIQHRRMIRVTGKNREGIVASGIAMDQTCQDFAGFPLLAGEEVAGGLYFARYDTGSLSDDLLQTAQIIAHQTGLALRNATISSRSARMRRNLTRINKFFQEIVFSTDVNTVIRTGCAVAQDISHADRISLFLRTDVDSTRYTLWHDSQLTPLHRTWLMQHPIRREQITHHTRVFTDIALTQDESLLEEGQIGEFRAKLEVALRSGNAPTGMMSLYYQKPRTFETAELELLETLTSQMAAAVENAELLHVLEVYASEQAQLVYLSRTSTSTLELLQVIDSVLGLLLHMFNVQHVYVGLLEPQYQRLRFYSIGNKDFNTDDYTIAVTDAGALYTLETVPRLISRADADATTRYLLEHTGDDAIAAASLVVNNDFVGVVVLGNPGQFADAEARLLELAANQIAVQIHNARQYRDIEEALDRRLRQLALLEDIARQISSALNVDQLIGNVLDAAIRATQADMAALALVTETGDFQIIGQELVDGTWLVRHLNRSREIGVMGRVARSRQRMIIADNATDADYLALLTERRYQSSLVVPLLKDNTILGVLNLESVQSGFFREEHAEFIESLAGHAVISIQNARLLHERQRQIDVLTELRKLALKLSSMTDRRSVVTEILRAALIILQGEAAVMFRYATDTREVNLTGSLQRTDAGFSRVSVPIPEALIFRAVNTGEIQLVEAVQEHRHFRDYPYRSMVNYASLVVAPIRHGGLVQEVLCVTFAWQRRNLYEELDTLERLLIQAAGHLENIALYERVLAVNSRLRVFLDSSTDGIILLDAAGNIVQANISADRLLGVEISGYAGHSYVDRLMTMDRDETGYDTVEGLKNMARILRFEPDRIMRRQFELPQSGQTRYIEESSTPVYDETRQSVIGRLIMLRDITEEKLLSDYRDEITNMIVHDLRSPLSAIYSSLSYGRMLLEDPDDPTLVDGLDPLIDVAASSAQNLLGLVDSLLDIARLETRSMPLVCTPVNLRVLVSDLLQTMSSLFADAGITPRVEIGEQIPEVFADGGKIRRVLGNLLDNAQRFTPQGGTVLIQAQLIDAGQRVVIRVVDSGNGIPPEERERIFDKFRQIAHSAPERGRRGSGLGLTFCKLVLEAHGERIWVEAESPLSGASFALTLPVDTGELREDNGTDFPRQ